MTAKFFGKSSSKNPMLERLFFKLLPVQLLIFAMNFVNTIVDGIIAGRYISERTVGVIGLFFAVIGIISAICSVVMGGGAVLSGRFIGTGELEKTRGIFSLCISLAVIIGLILSGICFFFPEEIALFCGADEGLKESLMNYSRGYAMGIVPMFVAQQLGSFLQLETQSKRNYMGVGAMIVSNILMDILFVTILKLDVFGLAIATSTCNWIYFLVLVPYYFSGKAQMKFSFSNIYWAKTLELIKIGSPGALLQVCLAMRDLTLNRIVLSVGGEAGLSSRASMGMITGLFVAIAVGGGTVIRMLASVYVGEEDRDSIKELIRLALTRLMAMMIFGMVLLFLLSGAMASIFFKDKTSEVYIITKQQFMIYTLAMPFILLVQIQTNYLQASGHNIAVHISSIMDGYVSVVVPAIILAPLMGVLGVWWATPIGILITSMVYVVYAIVWTKHVPRNVDEWLLFKPGFGVEDKDRLAIVINSMDDVIGCSETIQKFVSDHGYDKKTAYFSALALEEMAGNVVSHGFIVDKKEHDMDVRVICKKEGVMLRIKDDCVPFDPVERTDLLNPEDPTKNIGIRTIGKIATDMSYQNMLGLNVLTIEIDQKAG
ncbi:MATE family efflux transporter [Butyrivibrio sp. AE2032]|uniref:MATE family efflux transporter n=1 Tax=Butyrivibrio sp. AE2032 TaxID=1458463 RepID=UPI000558095C|nr:MATE family efflux transporter [Butyrivibrio sp. AE2032]